MKTTRIVCLFGLMGISGFTSVLAQEIDNQEQTITGHTIVEDWSGSEDFYLVNFSTSRSVPGGKFLAFVSKDILDDDVTVVSLFWHDDDPSGEDARDRVLAQARLVGQNDDYLVVPYRPHATSYSYWRMKDEFDLQRAFVKYLVSLGVVKLNFYGHGGGGQIALILAGDLPHLVRTIGLSSPYELCPNDYAHSPIERVKELPDVPILIVHDRPDESARLKDTYAYLLAVERARLSVRLVVEGATTDDFPHYGTMALLGRELYRHLPVHKSDRIVSDGSVSAELLAEMRYDMDLSRAYAKKHLGTASPPSDVFIGSDPEWLADRYVEALQLPEGSRQGKVVFFSNCRAVEASFTAMFISTCNEVWGTRPREARAGISAHEWFHVNVQRHFINTTSGFGGTAIPIGGPPWLTEGSAQVWARSVLDDFTNDPETEKASRRQRVPIDFDLLALNTRQGWQDAPAGKYDARDLAVWMLVDVAGLSGLEEFYRRLGEYIADEAAREMLNINTQQTTPVRDFKIQFFETPRRQQTLNEIFRSSFGQTMEQFAASFSEYLSQEEVSSNQASPDQQGVSHNRPPYSHLQ